MVGQVTNPPKVKELRDVERELLKWEEKAKALTKEFGETFSDTVKVGIVVSIMPPAVQELVYQSIGDKLDYDEVTAKIRSVMSNKVAMMEAPTPMDVGMIDHECESENLEDDVAAVSWSTQCPGCGGWGHLPRECPSVANDGKGGKAWGKGLGEKGKGKGLSTKGGQKGDSRGVKGSGKGGFKGSCFLCGQQGHRPRVPEPLLERRRGRG